MTTLTLAEYLEVYLEDHSTVTAEELATFVGWVRAEDALEVLEARPELVAHLGSVPRPSVSTVFFRVVR